MSDHLRHLSRYCPKSDGKFVAAARRIFFHKRNTQKNTVPRVTSNDSHVFPQVMRKERVVIRTVVNEAVPKHP